MCGLAGRFRLNGPPLDPAELTAMLSALRHRGPDGEGRHDEPGFSVGLKRLSIIDIAGGGQPLFNEDKRIVVFYNGEIYNHVELRRELSERGHQFRTGSDGEVIAHLYEERGIEFLQALNGMFGLCLWDRQNQTGLLARDRVGVKPLYFSHEGPDLTFASEIKSLLVGKGGRVAPNEKALLNYLRYMYVPGPETPFQGIEKLLPGHVLLFGSRGIERPRSYIRPAALPLLCLSESELKTQFESLLSSAVELQSRSDVPVGLFLSGGLDSGLLASLYHQRARGEIHSFSVRYKGASYDESPEAAALAEQLGFRHESVTVGPEEVGALLPRLLWHMDEPSADSALVAVYRVSVVAAKSVSVVLNGTGGDELFGGYDRYLPDTWFLRAWWACPEILKGWISRLLSFTAPGRSAVRKLSFVTSPDTAFLWKALQFKPYHLEGFFCDQSPRSLWPPEPLASGLPNCGERAQRYMELDRRFYLVDDLLLLLDKMTMAASLEGRVPLLDHRLIGWAARLPLKWKIHGRVKKWGLRRWLRGVLPREVLHRRKQGFGAPVGAWMVSGLDRRTVRLVSERPAERAQYYWGLRGTALENKLSDFNPQQRYALLVLEIWLRLFLDGESIESVTIALTSDQ